MPTEPNIFIGLYEIAGYNISLKKGFDELGISADLFALNDNLFRYQENTKHNFYLKLMTFIGNCNASISGVRPIRKAFWTGFQYLITAPLFFWVLFRYNTFIFAYGLTFFNLLELPIYKLFGKRVIFIFFGSDTRPAYINGKFADMPPRQCARIACQQKRRIRKIERYADAIINHPPTSHFHEQRFISFLRMGIPTPIDAPASLVPESPNRTIRILHSPSDPERKGTSSIRVAVNNLRAKGYSLDFVEITGRPNRDVMEELSRCDFVVDELYSDTAMARFAAEAAGYGKPAIVGGYAGLSDWGNLPNDLVPPVHHCHPDDIEAAIEKLIVDAEYRKKLGERANRFVRSQWSARAVAERYLRIIRGDVPREWTHEPRDVHYLHGWGLTEQKAQTSIRNMLTIGGTSALQLADKPELELRFLAFARAEQDA